MYFYFDRIRCIFKISIPAGKTWQRGHTERNAEDQEKRAGNLQYPGTVCQNRQCVNFYYDIFSLDFLYGTDNDYDDLGEHDGERHDAVELRHWHRLRPGTR